MSLSGGGADSGIESAVSGRIMGVESSGSPMVTGSGLKRPSQNWTGGGRAQVGGSNESPANLSRRDRREELLFSSVNGTSSASASAAAASAAAAPKRETVQIFGDIPMQGDGERETRLDPFPQAILDGTKVILRVRHNQAFQIDHSLKIIFSSHKLRRLERFIAYSTFLSDADNLTTVVIDSGSWNLKFIPVLPSLHGGVIYTRDGSAHVVLSVAGEIRRSKVSAPSLPCKVCNKFVSSHSFSNAKHIQDKALERSSLRDYRQSKGAAWSLHTSTIGMGGAGGGVIFVRVDDSIFRYGLGAGGCSIPNGTFDDDEYREDETDLSPDNVEVTPTGPPIRERRRRSGRPGSVDMSPLIPPGGCEQPVEFSEGRPIIWTAGLEFEFKTVMFCCKKVTGASGDGVIWVDNPRQSQSSHSVTI